MINANLHIVATHIKTGMKADLYFTTITQAKKHNPNFKDFTIIGVEE
jgi:hypothetical protein